LAMSHNLKPVIPAFGQLKKADVAWQQAVAAKAYAAIHDHWQFSNVRCPFRLAGSVWQATSVAQPIAGTWLIIASSFR
jgi:hypothetical protein